MRVPPETDKTFAARIERLTKAIWALMGIGFVSGGWVATIELRTQSNIKAIETVQNELRERDKRDMLIENRIATIEANSKTTAAGITRIEGILLGRK